MKLPDFILDYAKIRCGMKDISKENVFKFVRMLFENNFDDNEIEFLIEEINVFLGDR